MIICFDGGTTFCTGSSTDECFAKFSFFSKLKATVVFPRWIVFCRNLGLRFVYPGTCEELKSIFDCFEMSPFCILVDDLSWSFLYARSDGHY